MQHKKKPTVPRNLDDVAICTSTAGLHITRLKRKNNIKKKKLFPVSKKIFLASEHYYTHVNILLILLVQIYYMGTVL